MHESLEQQIFDWKDCDNNGGGSYSYCQPTGKALEIIGTLL